MINDAIFEIYNPNNQKTYKIFSDGHTEGFEKVFPNGFCIINRIPYHFWLERLNDKSIRLEK